MYKKYIINTKILTRYNKLITLQDNILMIFVYCPHTLSLLKVFISRV
jgi:hypothetical protein